jgi:hypothetical protein
MIPNQVGVVPAPKTTGSIPAALSTDLDQRWEAWQAKGAAHDHAFRRRMALAAPILLLAAAVVIYALLGR